MEQKLNHLLCNLVIEFHKLQKFGWYLQGNDFYQVQPFLKELTLQVFEQISETAEQILLLDGKPLSSLKEFLQVSSLDDSSKGFLSSYQIFSELDFDFNLLLNELKEIYESATEEQLIFMIPKTEQMICFYQKNLGRIHRQKNG